MGNTATSSSSSKAPDDSLPPDYFLPCDLGRADVVFAPIGRWGAGRLITSLAYDADNRIIATGSSSGLVTLISDKDIQNTLRLPDGYPIEQLHFLSDCRLFVCNGGVIEIWNWATGSKSFQFEIPVICTAVYGNRFVMFATEGGFVEILDVDHGRLSAYTVHPPVPEDIPKLLLSNPVLDQNQCRHVLSVANPEIISISLDGDCLYTAFSNSTIRTYDLRAQKTSFWIYSPDMILSMAVEPANFDRRGPPRVAVAGNTGRVTLWNQQDPGPCGYLTASEEGTEPILQIQWIASENLAVLLGASSPSVSIFSLSDYSLLSSFSCDIHQLLLIPFSSPVTCISSDRTGGLFISEFDQSASRCPLIPSDFAQCSFFESFSGSTFLNNWVDLFDDVKRPDPYHKFSQYLQGGACPVSGGNSNLLITVSDKQVISFWDGTSLFLSRFLCSVNLVSLCSTVFKDSDKSTVASCISLSLEPDCRIAIGFSNGCIAVIEHDREYADTFSAACQVHVHSHRVMLLQLCSNWDRIASADEHSVCLCEIRSGQILFAIQLQQTSCLFFCQIESTMHCPGEPLRNILLIGTKKRLLFAYDSVSGSCVNSEFAPVADKSPNDALNNEEGSSSLPADLHSASPLSFLFSDSVRICGVVDSHGCQIPIQDHSSSKSIYISPRYLVGSWNATLRVCELHCDTSGVRINSLCEVRYSHRILQCWLISVDIQHKEPSAVSAIVTIDADRRLQIRRLMDINCVLLESDIPADLRTEDIPKCSCTRDGRLSWITRGREIMTAVLFMDELRKVHAPVIARMDQTNLTEKKRSSFGFVSSIAKAIKGSTTEELFSQERIAENAPPKNDDEAIPHEPTIMTSKAKDNLEMVKQTAAKSENLHSAAADFLTNAKLLAASEKQGWF